MAARALWAGFAETADSFVICRDCLAETQVVETRDTGDTVKRRRACPNGHRFSTEEVYREDITGLRLIAERLADLRDMLAAPIQAEDAHESRPAPL